MIYVVTYTSKRGHIGLCSDQHGHARHTTKYEAERTLKDAIEGISIHSSLGRKDFALREFKTMKEAGQWVVQSNSVAA